jgi:hypothetical protein
MLYRYLIVSGVLAVGAWGQVTLGWSSGSSVKTGFTGSRDITVTSVTQPAAVAFTVNWSANMTGVAVTAAGALTAAQKSLSCAASPISNTDGTFSLACVASGLNATPIGNGSLATVTFTAAKTSNLTGTLSTTTDPKVTLLSASAAALALATTGGTTTIPFVKPGDLNGDGAVSAADVGLAVSMLLAQQCSPALDMNNDNVCDVTDLQALVNAIGS